MIILQNVLLRNRYTSVSEANTINALYKKANVWVPTKEHADKKSLLEITSTKNTMVHASKAWNASEYLFKKEIVFSLNIFFINFTLHLPYDSL